MKSSNKFTFLSQLVSINVKKMMDVKDNYEKWDNTFYIRILHVYIYKIKIK